MNTNITVKKMTTFKAGSYSVRGEGFLGFFVRKAEYEIPNPTANGGAYYATRWVIDGARLKGKHYGTRAEVIEAGIAAYKLR